MNPESVLILGCGSIGQRHLRCFLKTGRVNVIACDSNERLLSELKNEYGVKTEGDWREALRGECDAVVIATPAQLHVSMAREALRLGKHVLIEKPLSQSLDGVEELLELSKRAKCQAAVAYVYHAVPFLKEARSFLKEGDLGAVKQVVVMTGSPFHLLRPAYAQSYYRDHRMGGGAIQDGMTHIANWIESVLGPTDSVVCDAAHQVLADLEVEDTVHLMARHGEVLVNYSFNQFQAPQENFIQFNAVGGSVRVEFHQQRWGVHEAEAKSWDWHVCPVGDRDEHFVNQANAFLDQIEGQPPQLCSLEAAERTLRFNLAALESAKSGGRVACEIVGGIG